MIRQDTSLVTAHPHQQAMVHGVNPYEVSFGSLADSGGEGKPRQNILHVMHGVLRGRYLMTICLCLVLGGLGAYGGYKQGKPIYACTGAIRVQPDVKKVLYDGVETGTVAPNVQDSLVDAQMALVAGRKCIESALKQPSLVPYKPNPTDADVVALTSRLVVTRKNDVVQVEINDANDKYVTAVINAVIDAYKKLYIEGDVEADNLRKEKLTAMKAEHTAELDRIEKEVAPIAKPYGSNKIAPIYQTKRDQFNEVDKKIQTLEMDIATKTAKPAENAPVLSDRQLADHDLALSDLFGKYDTLERDIAVFMVQVGAKHLKTLQAKAEQEVIQKQIRDRGVLVRSYMAAGQSLDKNKDTVEDWKNQLAYLKTLKAQLQEDILAVGADVGKLEKLAQEETTTLEALRTVDQRLIALRTEDPSRRRIEIISRGEAPLSPDRDTRPRLAAAGGGAGVFMGFSAVVALSLLSGRMRMPEDLPADNKIARPVLGIIPTLSEGPNYAKRAAIAADSVHQTRTMLEIWGQNSKQLVIGVTSPSKGSGKTSVAMSLGVSFATAGLRTLLVDCDFIGGGLTTRLQAIVRRDMTSVLRRAGLVNDTQLDHAMRVAAQASSNGQYSRSTVEEICVDLGYLTPAELQAARAMQAGDGVGVLDALAGEPLISCVGKTGITNLSILPLGNATPAHAAKVSAHTLRQVLDAGRQNYDIIIVDTNTMLDSLEASVVASAVDGMIVTVARGGQRSLVTETLNRLAALACPVAGIVFNRARAADIKPITSSGRLGASVDASGTQQVMDVLEPAGRLATLGPLARAVVSRVPLVHEESEFD